MKVNVNDKTIFNVFLIIFFAVLVITSLGYNPKARLIPLIFGLLGLAMVFLQFLYDAFPSLNQKLRFLKEEGLSFSDKNPTRTVNEEEDKKKNVNYNWMQPARIFLWLGAFLVLLYYTGYLVAVPLFLLFFIWLEGGKKIYSSLVVSIGTGLFMYGLFKIILRTTL